MCRPNRLHIFAVMMTLVALACTITGCRSLELERAGSLLETGDYLRAQEVYEHVLKRRPDDFAGHYGMAMAHCAEAIERTELGLASPEDWYPAIYHMNVAVKIDRRPRALATLAILHYNLGASYRRSGQAEKAIARLERAVRCDSTLLKATNLLGALYHERGDLDKAARCYRRALAAHPDYPLAHFNLGALAWARGDINTARERLRHAASLAPGNKHFRKWLDKALESNSAGEGGR
ncbi:MAG: tetratricopeptide repeat protein [Chitinivibrionales bacterium]|nr:tetratricopeptide repeat protein [Chitinivibrionales bacterium]MBD3359038.1 tetratricopeptide repeat protein [Chitinivibrionales bacterium]